MLRQHFRPEITGLDTRVDVAPFATDVTTCADVEPSLLKLRGLSRNLALPGARSIISRRERYQAIESLSEKNRRATELFYLKEKSVAERAHILGISQAATRVRLTRSRTLLRELLTQVLDPRTPEQEATMSKTSRVDVDGLKCSFCGGSVEELELLITGPGVHICSSCVQACVHVMVNKHGFSLRLAPQLSDSVSRRISSKEES